MLGPLGSLLLAMSGPAPAAAPEEATHFCDAGPVERTFVGQPWLVYSCSDGRTLLVVAPGKASVDEFVYTVRTENGRTSVWGSGPGGGRDIAATTRELGGFTAADIAALIAETRSRSPASRAARGESVVRR